MAKDLFDLSGRVAVVTGGSRGLGREMAVGVRRTRRGRRGGEPQAGRVRVGGPEIEALGQRAVPVAYHAGQWADSDRLYEVVYAEFGRCDILVNNAGMSPLYPSVDAITESLYDKVMDVNLKGPFRLSALIGTRMGGPDHGGSDGGSIIFVSSIASHRPSPNELVYGAAKAGINNLTYGLARTLGPEGAGQLHRTRPVPHRHRQGLGPRRVQPLGVAGLRARPRWRAARDRRDGVVPCERRVVVHHRHGDRRRRRAPLTLPWPT